MRAHPYGIESVFFGHDTPEETIAATRHLEELRDAVTEAMRAGPDDSVAAPS
jgi:hypothetical protein